MKNDELRVIVDENDPIFKRPNKAAIWALVGLVLMVLLLVIKNAYDNEKSN